MREELRPVEPALCGGFAPGDPAAAIQREGLVAGGGVTAAWGIAG